MAEFSVTIKGISSLKDLDKLARSQQVIASRAINQIARRTRTQSARRLREQLNFPARYLSGQDGKIGVSFATPGNLMATLTASSEPRSLARFVVGSPRGKGKVRVEVQPGGVRSMPGAFLLNLNKGGDSALLAVRSPNKPASAFRPRRLGKSLWLLYGPSVSQALLHNGGQDGIWVEIEDDIANALEIEYLRQLKVEGF